MDPYIGEIRMFGGNFAPRGWAFCNGQILSIQQYAAVFAVLGVTYGGNGQTTFGLPNLQGRVPMHWGNGPGLSPRVIGETAGSESVQLLPTQMPIHNHMVMAAATGGTQASPNGNYIAETADENLTTYNTYAPSGTGAMLNPQSITPAGGGQPHSNLQPYQCVSFIIALEGVFPPRP